jgi:hypothetical protein
MYVYVDKYDYGANNLNTEDINEEINLIEDKLVDVEQSNLSYFKYLREKVWKTKGIVGKIDFQNDKIMQERFENITNQIYSLQMKQFAESISTIKKDVKKNKYVLIFDSSEGVDPLTLDEGEYKELLCYRDPMNSISIYDLFQEKIHSY